MSLDASADQVDSGQPSAEDQAAHARTASSRDVKRGLSWSFASTLLTRASGLLTGILLARLLEPKDFGVFAVATVALILLSNLNDLGVEQSLVRWPESLKKIAPTAVTVIFGFSVLLFAVFYLLAPVYTGALQAPEATGIIRLLAAGLIVNGVAAVPSALLTRSFAQDKKAYGDLAGFVVGTAVTVVLAVLGYGAWSLAWGRVLGNAVNSLVQIRLAPQRYRPGWSPDAARALLRSGLPLAGATIVAILVMNVDYVVVGRVLGPVQLGFYVLAFNLAGWPYNIFSRPVATVSIAAFARLQDRPAELQRAFARGLSLTIAITGPLCLLLALLAEPTVRFVYGTKWDAAAAVLSFLALFGLARVVLQLTFELIVAVGRSRLVLALQTLWLVVLAPSVAVGASVAGIRGVGVAHLAVAFALMLPAFAIMLSRMGFSVRVIGSALRRPVFGLPLVALGPLASRALLHSDFWVVAVGGLLGLLAYFPVVAPILPLQAARERLRRMVRRGRREQAVAG